MKILIISQYFWPENFRINDFAIGLSERGHEITVLTGIPNYPGGKYFNGYFPKCPKFERYKKIAIYRSFLFARGNGNKIRLFLNYISFALFASIKVTFLSKKGFDIIFVHEPSPITVGIPAMVLKYIKKIPIVFWVMDLWPESVTDAGNIKSKFIINGITSIVKLIYKSSDKILVTSRAFKPSIIEKNVDREKIIYFPQWAESLFYPISCSDSKYHKFFPDGFKIVFAGNIGEAQDFKSILKAAELVADNINIQWIIIGDGRKREWLKNQISSKKLDKTFHLIGEFPLKAMPDLYSYADAMLITLKRSEVFSLTIPAKIQSYLACAKPILTMMDGEGSNIINESKSGLTANSGDFSTLIKNVIQMSKMEQKELTEMGGEGRKYFEKNFERSYLINKAEKLFLKMIR